MEFRNLHALLPAGPFPDDGVQGKSLLVHGAGGRRAQQQALCAGPNRLPLTRLQCGGQLRGHALLLLCAVLFHLDGALPCVADALNHYRGNGGHDLHAFLQVLCAPVGGCANRTAFQWTACRQGW